MMAKKKKQKKDYSRVEVSPEKRGKVTGRMFDVYEKDGSLDKIIEVDHIKESPPGKSDVYLSQETDYTGGGKKKSPIRLHRTKKDVGKRYPRISPKLPKLR